MKCHECGDEITSQPPKGMNMPGVTPGPVYWCWKCTRPEDIAQMIKDFIDPPKEAR